ncbi:type VI secretion lipoprotein TssJ, partial [Pseudomonas sp. xss_4]
DTRYLAVFANFHDQNGATWKQVLRLEPNGHKYALLVTLHDNAVAITEERYRQPKPRPMK